VRAISARLPVRTDIANGNNNKNRTTTAAAATAAARLGTKWDK
jgi:hypothetical protein